MIEETKKFNNEGQVFYFNDDGELIVESNKGIVVDGKEIAKIYGRFTCSAKTLGMIIAELKGKRVAVGKLFVPAFNGENKEQVHLAIVNPTEYDKKVEDALREAEEKKEECEKSLIVCQKLKRIFNAMPWYKKIFFKFNID